MRKVLAIVQIFLLVVVFASFLSNNQDYAVDIYSEDINHVLLDDFDSEAILNEEELNYAILDPKEFVGSSVMLGGKLRVDPIQTNDGYELHIWTDVINRDFPIVVTVPNEVDLKAYDYILLTGVVRGKGYIYNSRALPMKGMKVEANSVVKSTYTDVAAPAVKTVEVNQVIKKGGVSVKLTTIEFSKVDTRVNFEVDNPTKGNFAVFKPKNRLALNDKSYKPVQVWRSEYDRLEQYIPAHSKDAGTLVFKAFGDYAGSEVTVTFKGRSYSAKENETFKWTVSVPN